MALFEKRITNFLQQQLRKKSPEALIFQLPQYKRGIIVADTEVVYDPEGSLSAG